MIAVSVTALGSGSETLDPEDMEIDLSNSSSSWDHSFSSLAFYGLLSLFSLRSSHSLAVSSHLPSLATSEWASGFFRQLVALSFTALPVDSQTAVPSPQPQSFVTLLPLLSPCYHLW